MPRVARAGHARARRPATTASTSAPPVSRRNASAVARRRAWMRRGELRAEEHGQRARAPSAAEVGMPAARLRSPRAQRCRSASRHRPGARAGALAVDGRDRRRPRRATASAPCDPASAASKPSRRKPGRVGQLGARPCRRRSPRRTRRRAAGSPRRPPRAPTPRPPPRPACRAGASMRTSAVTASAPGRQRGSGRVAGGRERRERGSSTPQARARARPRASAPAGSGHDAAPDRSRCAPRRGRRARSPSTPSTSAKGSTSARGSSPRTRSRLGERHAHVAAGARARPPRASSACQRAGEHGREREAGDRRASPRARPTSRARRGARAGASAARARARGARAASALEQQPIGRVEPEGGEAEREQHEHGGEHGDDVDLERARRTRHERRAVEPELPQRHRGGDRDEHDAARDGGARHPPHLVARAAHDGPRRVVPGAARDQQRRCRRGRRMPRARRPPTARASPGRSSGEQPLRGDRAEHRGGNADDEHLDRGVAARAAMPRRRVRAGARSRRVGTRRAAPRADRGRRTPRRREQHGQRRDRAHGAEPGEEAGRAWRPARRRRRVRRRRSPRRRAGRARRSAGRRAARPRARASSPRDPTSAVHRTTVAAGRSTSASSSTRNGPAPPSTAPVATIGSPNHAGSFGSSGCQVPTTSSRRGPSPSCELDEVADARGRASAAARRVQGRRRASSASAAATAPRRRRATTRSRAPTRSGTPSSASSTAPNGVAVVDGVDRRGLDRAAPRARRAARASGRARMPRPRPAPRGRRRRGSAIGRRRRCRSPPRGRREGPTSRRRRARRRSPVPKPERRNTTAAIEPSTPARAAARANAIRVAPTRSPRDVGPGARETEWCRASAPRVDEFAQPIGESGLARERSHPLV